MLSVLNPIFERYERLCAELDQLFERVYHDFPACVSCKPACSDCCHAMFDLPLIEALYLNRAFNAQMGFGPERSAVIDAAGEADRKSTRIKRELYRQSKELAPEEIMQEAARIRLRCPLLNSDERCHLYDWRPVTCRLYGIPASIGGVAHVCGKSAFDKGQAYPTLALDKIQDRLAAMSQEAAQVLGSRFKELHLVYVPVSMALLTHYDAEYLGIGPAKQEKT